MVLPETGDEPQLHGRARFEAALAAGPTDGARSADVATALALAESPIARMAEVMYGSNAVFVLEFNAADALSPGQPMRAVYKPVRGERPLWDFPRHTLYLREVAAYLVDAALGLGHVPPTVLRDGPLGPGSVQLYVHGSRRLPDDHETEAIERSLRDVAMLDALINNADRKRSHLLLGSDMRIRAIDNALSFLPYPRQRTALIGLGGTPLPAPSRKRLRRLVAHGDSLKVLCERLSRLLSQKEVDAFAARALELHADPVYPLLDDWDGRPFEWW